MRTITKDDAYFHPYWPNHLLWRWWQVHKQPIHWNQLPTDPSFSGARWQCIRLNRTMFNNRPNLEKEWEWRHELISCRVRLTPAITSNSSWCTIALVKVHKWRLEPHINTGANLYVDDTYFPPMERWLTNDGHINTNWGDSFMDQELF